MTGTLRVFGVPGSPATAGLHPVKKYTSCVLDRLVAREAGAPKIASAMSAGDEVVEHRSRPRRVAAT